MGRGLLMIRSLDQESEQILSLQVIVKKGEKST